MPTADLHRNGEIRPKPGYSTSAGSTITGGASSPTGTGPYELPVVVSVISPGSPNRRHPFPAQESADQYLATQMLLVSADSVRLVQAEFRYRWVDPFAVQLRLSLARLQAVSWTFSRDLLIAGIRRPSGIGDVRVYPGGDGLLIELGSTADAHAVLLADRLQIEQFLGHTVSKVPIGSEIDHYDVDAELIRLSSGRHPPCGA